MSKRNDTDGALTEYAIFVVVVLIIFAAFGAFK